MLCLASAAAQETLPEASGIRDRIGQTVEFQDKIVAISYSRSTNGYYLNFGAPFPAQLLSVWVGHKLYRLLPSHHALVGRTVRIKGLLENSSTGPLLKLDSADAFQLLPLDDSALTKSILDGEMDRVQFKAVIRQKFDAGEFETLEVLAEDLRKTRERFSDGTWLTDAFFSSLALGSRASDAEYETVEQQLARWETAYPGSLVAMLMQAGFYHDRAFKARGGAVTKQTTPEQLKAFKVELDRSRALLEAHPAAKMYPAYFTRLQKIALDQHWPRAEFMRIFDEATALEPDYYGFYFNAAQYLLPKWWGRRGEWQAFAESQRQRHGAGAAGDALYARIVWSLRPTQHHPFRNTGTSWDITASGFEYLIRQYPKSRWLRNAYANFAWKAGDRARLRLALAEIRRDPDMNIWVNLENFGMAEHFAASEE
ncbi:MAG: hypothetical protein ACR2NX_13850 [Chthoniobacterales bacterium]